MRTKITLIISCVLISGCLARNQTSTPKLSAAESIYSPSPVVSNSLVPTPTFPTLVVTPQTVIMSPTTMPIEQYEILSPLAIKKGNITIEVVSYTITSSIFRFGIRITGLSPSQIPESSPESFVPIKEVEFFIDQDTPLALAFLGGGGGGGTNDDGTVTINQDFAYKLMSPLPVGQKQHIIALVTLHEIFGIAEPIRFDLEITPDEGVGG